MRNKELIKLIDEKLAAYIQSPIGEERAAAVYKAMEYAMFPGGKRVRPLLLLSVCESLGGNANDGLPFACALEMIHAYSLIHDDLPAMDNDDFRRGKPSTHKAFGEANAILAGDALLNRAYEVMADACIQSNIQSNFQSNFENNKSGLMAMKIIADSAGILGMVGGQAADIDYENKDFGAFDIEYIHKRKTSALFAAASSAGAWLSGKGELADEMYTAGEELGQAFQIADDISDAGKNEKNSYIYVHGLEKSESDRKWLAKNVVKKFNSICGKDSLAASLAGLIIGDY